MILLKVDEAYAFDYLAILEVKNSKIKNNVTSSNLSEYSAAIEHQLGEKFHEVINSEEYNKLVKANEKSFNIIDLVRSGTNVTAQKVDDLNTDRFIIKKELQKKFFNQEITEQKNL